MHEWGDRDSVTEVLRIVDCRSRVHLWHQTKCALHSSCNIAPDMQATKQHCDEALAYGMHQWGDRDSVTEVLRD